MTIQLCPLVPTVRYARRSFSLEASATTARTIANLQYWSCTAIEVEEASCLRLNMPCINIKAVVGLTRMIEAAFEVY